MKTTMSSQDRYLRTGEAKTYRVRGDRGNWWVEGTDSNRVWVDAEPGTRCRTQAEAIQAALEFAPISALTWSWKSLA
jgi:hypothetical protein